MSEISYSLSKGIKGTEFGMIPDDWTCTELECILKVIRNGVTAKQNKAGRGIPVTRIETISDGRVDGASVGYVENITPDQREKYTLELGDILLSHINSEPHIGKSAIYEGEPAPLLHGMNLLMIRADQDLCSPWFLNYVFQYYRSSGIFRSLASRAVGQASINQGRMKSMGLYLPPLPEQRKIAAVLSTVQEAKERTEAVIEAARELKKSMMRYLFTYGPVPVDEAEDVLLKETEIGLIPEEWDIRTLDSIVEVNPENRDPSTQNPKAPFDYIDISAVEGGTGRITEVQRIMGEEVPSRARRIVQTDDVILSTVRPYLKAFTVVPSEYDDAICSTGFAVLRSNGQVIPRYVLAAAQSWGVMQQFASQMRGANYPAVNIGQVKSLKFPIAHRFVQERIANVISSVNSKILTEHNREKALEDLFLALLQNLMAAKIRVNDLEIDMEGISARSGQVLNGAS